MSDWAEGAASGAAAGTAVMPGWGTVIGAGIGLVGGMMGNSASAEMAEDANRQNWEMFGANAQFQREMAKRAYTYRVEDLKLAGLNPMLAIGGPGGSLGGGGTSPAVTPQYRNLGEAATSGAAAMRADAMSTAQIQLLQSQSNAANAQARNSSAVAAREEMVNAFMARESGVGPEGGLRSTMFGSQFMMNLERLDSEIGINRSQIKLLENTAGREDLIRNVLKSDAFRNFSSGELDKIHTALSRTTMQAHLNNERAEHTEWGRNVRPYLSDAGQIVNSAGSMARIYRDVRSGKNYDWQSPGSTNTRTGESIPYWRK